MLAVIPFDHALSQKSPEEFVNEVLVKGLGARSIYVGHDWRFGHRARGDVSLLTEMGSELGFVVHGVGLESAGDEPISSSRIRALVRDGDMEAARDLLGRPFDLEGEVVVGDRRGRSLGYPTANVAFDKSLARPPVGVYAGVCHVAGRPGWQRSTSVSIPRSEGPASRGSRLTSSTSTRTSTGKC